MPRPRKLLINLSDTPYYHCVSRCVRRAFLCGQDHVSGRSYEHRRQWVENRLLTLARVFTIDICAYAVMSNHTHVVLHVDKQKADALSHEEVLRRWHKLHNGTLLTRKYVDVRMRETMTEAERDSVILCANIYRQRLHDISWFMRHLNEYIARMANKEDECTGRFWEGRFKSQALLDEAALLACMAYVDLNPIRAGKATTPENSAHTSIKRRIKAAKNNQQPRKLMPLIGNQPAATIKGLPFVLADYLALVEYTGRQLSVDKPGAIPSHCAPLIQRTGLQLDCWGELVNGIETEFSTRISVTITHRKLAS